eukprot:934439_1
MQLFENLQYNIMSLTNAKESVRTLHLAGLRHGEGNSQNETQIVRILGGIDQILQNYLSESSNIFIDIQQLNKLKQLLETPDKFQIHNKSQPLNAVLTQRSNNLELNESAKNRLIYHLDDTNTCLHAAIGNERATQWLDILHHSITRTTVLTIIFSNLVLFFIPISQATNTLYIVLRSCCWLFAPYTMVLISSANHKALPMAIGTFEFWYKTLNAICVGVFYSWIDYLNNREYWVVTVITGIAHLIFAFLGMIFISGLDAFPLSVTWKVSFTFSIAAMYMCALIWCAIEFNGNDYERHIVYLWIIPLSLEGLLLGGLRTLNVFCWKQVVLSILRRKTDKCVLIHHIAFIKWDGKTTNTETQGRIDAMDENVSTDHEHRETINANMDTHIDISKDKSGEHTHDIGLRFPVSIPYNPESSSESDSF